MTKLSKGKKLKKDFFLQKTKTVAQKLLGKVLVRKSANRRKDKILSGIITETEAYIGPHDLASHASKGKTQRTKIMFCEAGTWYVYLVYGFYYCLNVITEEEDYPAAVLIRSIKPLEGLEEMKKNRKKETEENLANGPGKLCQALEINKNFNNTSAISKDSFLYIEDRGIKVSPQNIIRAKRIGVDYAGKWKDRLLRFHIKEIF